MTEQRQKTVLLEKADAQRIFPHGSLISFDRSDDGKNDPQNKHHRQEWNTDNDKTKHR